MFSDSTQQVILSRYLHLNSTGMNIEQKTFVQQIEPRSCTYNYSAAQILCFPALLKLFCLLLLHVVLSNYYSCFTWNTVGIAMRS